MLTRIDPPLPLVTPKGEGWAHFLIDYGIEFSLYWIVFLDNGQVWRLPNEQVRACKNYTAERPNPERP